ncbi:MAG: formyltetrahydrofolate deformylase [Acidimicrobiales bacterium]|jgi:formyltetrahydrofolate deformylase|nr:formyltetrahydrofolate deformylase [Acidimicrobiales bacterium]
MAELRGRHRPSVLLVRADDRPGIVAAVANLIADAGGNIANADQHTDRASRVFLQRIEIDGDPDWSRLGQGLADAAERLALRYDLHHPGVPTRMVLACSTDLSCAADVLGRVALGELDAEVVAVVSDKDAAEALADRHDVAFRSVAGGLEGASRAAQEQLVADVLDELDPDLVVLARYMRILPASITEAWTGRMINIHHSFLPAFAGARPYHRAHERGVKVIGATAHYVTAELDAGPIIAQRVTAVTHRDEVEDLVRKGRDVERQTLADAVRLHLEHRVLVWDNRTCVFA